MESIENHPSHQVLVLHGLLLDKVQNAFVYKYVHWYMQANLSLDHDKQEACLVFCLDARGLIRWMLMVNPERRATVEDIANHWWVNWDGRPVCVTVNHKGMLARPCWLVSLTGRTGTEPRPTKAIRSEPFLLVRQRPKKSKKENDVGVSSCNGEDSLGLKRPKGILKTRTSEEQRSPSLEEIESSVGTPEKESGPEGEEGEEEQGLTGHSPTKVVSILPKKGILKNNQQRESGYYSSPERSESSDLLGGNITPLAASSPPKRAVGRKGILKRNGKYSTYSGAPPLSVLGEPAPGDSGLSRSQSRPSSIVREDSDTITNSSFSGTDWPPPRARPNIRSCMSAENLLQLANFKGLQAAPPLHSGKFSRGTQGSPGDNSSFSLLGDLDDMTQVYQQALDISNNLS